MRGVSMYIYGVKNFLPKKTWGEVSWILYFKDHQERINFGGTHHFRRERSGIRRHQQSMQGGRGGELKKIYCQ